MKKINTSTANYLFASLLMIASTQAFAFQKIECGDQASSIVLHGEGNKLPTTRDSLLIDKPNQAIFFTKDGQPMSGPTSVSTVGVSLNGKELTYTSNDFRLVIDFGDQLRPEKFTPCGDDDEGLCKNVPGHGRGTLEAADYSAVLTIDGETVLMECFFFSGF